MHMLPENRNNTGFQNQIMIILKEWKTEDTTGCTKPPKLPA